MKIRLRFKFHRVYKPDMRDILIALALVSILVAATILEGEIW